MADEPIDQRVPLDGGTARQPHRTIRLQPEDLALLQAMHDRIQPGDPWRYLLTDDGQLGLRNEKTGEALGGIDQAWRSRSGNDRPRQDEP